MKYPKILNLAMLNKAIKYSWICLLVWISLISISYPYSTHPPSLKKNGSLVVLCNPANRQTYRHTTIKKHNLLGRGKNKHCILVFQQMTHVLMWCWEERFGFTLWFTSNPMSCSTELEQGKTYSKSSMWPYWEWTCGFSATAAAHKHTPTHTHAHARST